MYFENFFFSLIWFWINFRIAYSTYYMVHSTYNYIQSFQGDQIDEKLVVDVRKFVALQISAKNKK